MSPSTTSSPTPPKYQPATLAIHADDHTNITTDVAPAIHLSTTFRYPRNPLDLAPVPASDEEITTKLLGPSAPLVYSRLAAPNINRLESLLAPLLFPTASNTEAQRLANHVVSYSSGLSAFHALLVNLVPKVIAISGGYHGCHGVIDLHKKMHGIKTVDLHADDAAWDAACLGPGDLVHLETPLNPTGEAYSIQHYAKRAHARGALLSVDATFGPPGLQDPFKWGTDVVMHSGTKYIGGHSDLLCGILAVKPGPEGAKMATGLRAERVYLGSVMGGLEGWLGVRSLRTLELRVGRQSKNADALVGWLDGCLTGKDEGEEGELVKALVGKVVHASLQKEDMAWLSKQMPNGFGPVFSIWMKDPRYARTLPSKLALFHHATSLGGVESLIEWRRMSDTGVDERLLRVSVGVEDWNDLRADLVEGFRRLAEEDEGQGAALNEKMEMPVRENGNIV
ncbi:cystathionine gamma-synthase-like protein [Lepidopterella palustris CBS 459.81]|uniref:Cystathionine gamma-synthase-like protein n=1 Tax=Lepidopterella palustris CBS 459.81 TaxID=1314670 RepID=A0A8E2EI18_9PEZI|nr:cystathionine gamma-synthase-like protein [Lepidopterella palustris CBS 459.81]